MSCVIEDPNDFEGTTHEGLIVLAAYWGFLFGSDESRYQGQ